MNIIFYLFYNFSMRFFIIRLDQHPSQNITRFSFSQNVLSYFWCNIFILRFDFESVPALFTLHDCGFYQIVLCWFWVQNISIPQTKLFQYIQTKMCWLFLWVIHILRVDLANWIYMFSLPKKIMHEDLM